MKRNKTPKEQYKKNITFRYWVWFITIIIFITTTLTTFLLIALNIETFRLIAIYYIIIASSELSIAYGLTYTTNKNIKAYEHEMQVIKDTNLFLQIIDEKNKKDKNNE